METEPPSLPPSGDPCFGLWSQAHDERADQEAAAAAWREKVAAVEWKDPEVPIVVSEVRESGVCRTECCSAVRSSHECG